MSTPYVVLNKIVRCLILKVYNFIEHLYIVNKILNLFPNLNQLQHRMFIFALVVTNSLCNINEYSFKGPMR